MTEAYITEADPADIPATADTNGSAPGEDGGGDVGAATPVFCAPLLDRIRTSD